MFGAEVEPAADLQLTELPEGAEGAAATAKKQPLLHLALFIQSLLET
jgi:hypothetical protein